MGPTNAITNKLVLDLITCRYSMNFRKARTVYHFSYRIQERTTIHVTMSQTTPVDT
ncbi:hypothetical protein HanIR_Chr01g0046221 [Helianthus annuus]|nr:hypothetical protein HanIR_Chr01g0046221 [Helianthus annuus]